MDGTVYNQNSMSWIEHYQVIIQEKVKITSFRDFVKYLAGWYPVNFYRRKEGISIYPETPRSPKLVPPSRFTPPELEIWEYDFSLSLFENYRELFHKTPLSALRQFPPIENSEYTDWSGWWTHNSYLDIGLYDVENVFYSFEVKEHCKNVFNSVMVWYNSENVFQSNCIVRSSFIFYSRYILDSSHIWFSTNLIGCHDCIFCDNLTNASYCIENKQYTKENFEIVKAKMLKDQKNFMKYFLSLPRSGNNLVSENVSGSYITNSRNVENGFYSFNITEGKNTILVGSMLGNSHMYNVISAGSPFFDHGYSVVNSWWGNHVYCSDFIVGSNVYYSYYLENCSFCLGCIWLKNNSYCILNKQYTKEEWERLAEKIFASMEADGTLGNFFPASMNPYYFNDTAACIFDSSFTKEEVTREGYLWRDEPIHADIPEWLKVIKNTELHQYQGFRETPFPKGGVMQWQEDLHSEQNPQSPHSSSTDPLPKELTWYIDPEILNVIISDEKGNYYRIVEMEYDFLMKHGLPLPTMYWLDRMKIGFTMGK